MNQEGEPTGLFDYLPRVRKGGRTIRRKGYTRKAYTRKTGTRVKGSRVPSRRIKDVGYPGKGVLGTGQPGIGKMKQGELSTLGYQVSDKPSTRRRAVDRAVAKYGKLSALRKLNAVSVYTRRTSPKKSKTFKSDVRYIQKKYY
jgi:hypothetical protein